MIETSHHRCKYIWTVIRKGSQSFIAQIVPQSQFYAITDMFFFIGFLCRNLWKFAIYIWLAFKVFLHKTSRLSIYITFQWNKILSIKLLFRIFVPTSNWQREPPCLSQASFVNSLHKNGCTISTAWNAISCSLISCNRICFFSWQFYMKSLKNLAHMQYHDLSWWPNRWILWATTNSHW